MIFHATYLLDCIVFKHICELFYEQVFYGDLHQYYVLITVYINRFCNKVSCMKNTIRIVTEYMEKSSGTVL